MIKSSSICSQNTVHHTKLSNPVLISPSNLIISQSDLSVNWWSTFWNFHGPHLQFVILTLILIPKCNYKHSTDVISTFLFLISTLWQWIKAWTLCLLFTFLLWSFAFFSSKLICSNIDANRQWHHSVFFHWLLLTK